MVVLSTEWLAGEMVIMRELLYKVQPESQFILQPQHINLRTSVRESSAYIKSIEFPYCKFEVHL